MIIQAHGILKNNNAAFSGKANIENKPDNADNTIKEEDRKTLYVGDSPASVEEKLYGEKLAAQRDAMRLKLAAYESDSSLDDTIDNIHTNISDLNDKVLSARNEVRDLQALREEQDALGENTDELAKAEEVWQQIADDGLSEITANRRQIFDVKIEAAKSAPMVEADAAADKMTEAAAKDVASGLFSDAVTSIQEKFQENYEEALKKAAKAEKESAKTAETSKEASGDSNTAAGKTSDNSKDTAGNASSSSNNAAGKTSDTLRDDINELVKANNLLTEDTLGLIVNQNL